MKTKIWLIACLALVAAVIIILYLCYKPSIANIKPFKYFEKDKYLGKWYEIARYDFKYEKNMSHVTAKYSMNSNGTIRIENTGYDYGSGEKKTKIGKAKFAGPQNIGALKVSFFWPFYSGYNILAVDEEYKYSLVAGDNYDLLWILSRTPSMPENVVQNYLAIAENAGYDIEKLVWTKQD